MNTIYYIGLDIHKKVIAYCIKRIDGELVWSHDRNREDHQKRLKGLKGRKEQYKATGGSSGSYGKSPFSP